MPRDSFYRLLEEKGFSVATGPTFSVNDESDGYPAYQNVLMQRRHHRVIQELQHFSFIAAPNIYWRNERDIREWTGWLISNENVRTVTRDFSRTKLSATFQKELDGLVRILGSLGRPVHVLLIGVAENNGITALRKLAKIGCTATIISSSPIRKAIGGRRLKITDFGNLISQKDLAFSREQLVKENLETMEEYLVSQALTLPTYKRLKSTLYNRVD